MADLTKHLFYGIIKNGGGIKMKNFSITEINRALIGSIGFYGETNQDERSLENLEVVKELLNYYVNKVVCLSMWENCGYASGEALWEEARKMLENIKVWIDGVLD